MNTEERTQTWKLMHHCKCYPSNYSLNMFYISRIEASTQTMETNRWSFSSPMLSNSGKIIFFYGYTLSVPFSVPFVQSQYEHNGERHARCVFVCLFVEHWQDLGERESLALWVINSSLPVWMVDLNGSSHIRQPSPLQVNFQSLRRLKGDNDAWRGLVYDAST